MNHLARFLSGALLLFALATIPNVTLAQNIEGNIDLPVACVVTDKDGGTHTFPKEDSPSAYLAVCALAKALETGLVSSVQLDKFPGFGLFVEGLHGIVAGADEFWALWLNDAFAECGIECLPLSEGDAVSFILTSFEGEERGTSVVLHISSLLNSSGTPSPIPSSGGGEYLQGRTFDVSAAFEFLVSKQNANGSFASALLTDWAAVAFGAADSAVCNDPCRAARQKLRLYLLAAKPELSSVTDFERHALALIALGINPYSEAGRDYIAPIVSAFDGTQVGDATLVNDDIFALFPLLHAGYAKTDDMIEAITAFILFKQKINGSWEGSIDLTASAIQALQLFPSQAGVAEAIEQAEEFLRRNQNESGIFGPNSFSIGWVLQAIAALGQTPEEWEKSGITLLGYLGILQQEDGGVEPMSASADMRVWATSYAIPGALAKPWDDILANFARPQTTELTATSTLLVVGESTTTEHGTQTTSSLAVTKTVAKPSTPEPPTTNMAPIDNVKVEPASQLALTERALSLFGASPQTAAAREAGGMEGIWVWFAGSALILFTLFYLLWMKQDTVIE